MVLLTSFSNQFASSHHCSTVSVICVSDNVEEELSFIITPYWLRHLWYDLNDTNDLNDFITSNYQYLTVATFAKLRHLWYDLKDTNDLNDFITPNYNVSVSNSCNLFFLKIMSGLLSLQGTDYGPLGGIY